MSRIESKSPRRWTKSKRRKNGDEEGGETISTPRWKKKKKKEKKRIVENCTISNWNRNYLHDRHNGSSNGSVVSIESNHRFNHRTTTFAMSSERIGVKSQANDWTLRGGKKRGGGQEGRGEEREKKGRKKKRKRDLVAATALYRAGCWIESIGRLLVGDTLF